MWPSALPRDAFTRLSLSALNDRRFSPIEPSELCSLDVSVSLLVKYEQARHVEDWEVRCRTVVGFICTDIALLASSS